MKVFCGGGDAPRRMVDESHPSIGKLEQLSDESTRDGVFEVTSSLVCFRREKGASGPLCNGSWDAVV